MNSHKPERKEMVNSFQKAAPYLSIGYTLIGAILLFGFIGYKLDEWLEKSPLFLIIGLFFGFFLGLYRMIKVINELERK